MSRYQIYLNSKTVSILDQVADRGDLTRSHIIRDILDRVALELNKTISVKVDFGRKKDPLLLMSGIGKSSTGQIAQDVDSIYETAD